LSKLSKLFTKKEIDKLRSELIAKHGNRCAVCNRPREDFKNNLAVDHNHKSDKIRGLLCFYCNKRVVGRHTIESAEKILAYLLKYDERANEEN
jgi:hypothetical protein